MTMRERLEKEMEDLRTTRDELRLRVHLGKMDAQAQWEQVEKQWQHAESKLKSAREAGREIAGEVGEAVNLAIEEMKQGYAKLRKLL